MSDEGARPWPMKQCDCLPNRWCAHDIENAKREATQRERERCAEIADSYCCKAECGGTQDADHHSQCWTADAIAAAIRGGE